MTAQEFRYEFDLLYNNIMSDMGPGLDDYEVSLFLTQAQEEIVQQLYAGSSSFDGFEASEKVRRNLANLLVRQTLTLSTSTDIGNGYKEFSASLQGNLLALLSERVKISDVSCGKDKWVNVVPVKYDELNKVLENPFRRPSNRNVLRLDKSTTGVSIIAMSTAGVSLDYEYEYLKKPQPIIVADLPAGFTINGQSTASTSALDESLHRPIIKYAVQLAAASWASNNKS